MAISLFIYHDRLTKSTQSVPSDSLSRLLLFEFRQESVQSGIVHVAQFVFALRLGGVTISYHSRRAS